MFFLGIELKEIDTSLRSPGSRFMLLTDQPELFSYYLIPGFFLGFPTFPAAARWTGNSNRELALWGIFV